MIRLDTVVLSQPDHPGQKSLYSAETVLQHSARLEPETATATRLSTAHLSSVALARLVMASMKALDCLSQAALTV